MAQIEIRKGEVILDHLCVWWQDNFLGDAEPRESRHCQEQNVPGLSRRIADVGIGMQRPHPAIPSGVHKSHIREARTGVPDKVGHAA